MKKWMSLLLAGVLVSAFLVGCKKEEEGSTTPPATTGTDGKMEEKKGTDGAPAPENKMDGESKTGG